MHVAVSPPSSVWMMGWGTEWFDTAPFGYFIIGAGSSGGWDLLLACFTQGAHGE
jgi:hypothetical protein